MGNIVNKIKKITSKKSNRILTYVSVLMICISLVIFSYFNPGEFKNIDSFRLYFQIKVMDFVGKTYIGEYNLDKNGNKIAGKDRITYEELKGYFNELETGDIICTESTNCLSAEFIPGKWKHSAIYIGNKSQFEKLIGTDSNIYNKVRSLYKTGNEILIIDSSVYGVTIRDFSELYDLKNVSCLKSLIAYRIDTSKKNKMQMIGNAVNYVGKKYDYDMLTEDESSIYCVELIYHALKSIDIAINNSSNIAGRSVITPTNFVSYLESYDKAQGILLLEKKNYIVSNKMVERAEGI